MRAPRLDSVSWPPFLPLCGLTLPVFEASEDTAVALCDPKHAQSCCPTRQAALGTSCSHTSVPRTLANRGKVGTLAKERGGEPMMPRCGWAGGTEA